MALLQGVERGADKKLLIPTVVIYNSLQYFFNKRRKKTLPVSEKVVFLHSDLRKRKLFERLNKADVTQLVE